MKCTYSVKHFYNCLFILISFGVIVHFPLCISHFIIHTLCLRVIFGTQFLYTYQLSCYFVLCVFLQVYFIASIGQYLDTSVSRSRNFNRFTLEQYNITNKLKSSFYAIKSPLLLALALSNKLNKASFALVDDLSADIGILVQIHVSYN